MHFHVPKPLHGWREFAGEVGIIVLGVLIALGAEQAIEWLHSRDQQRQRLERLFDESRADVAKLRLQRDEMLSITRPEGEFAAALTTGSCPAVSRWSAVSTLTIYPSVNVPSSVYDEVVGAAGLASIPSSGVRKAVGEFHSELAWVQSQIDYFRTSHESGPVAIDDARVSVRYDPSAEEPEIVAFDRVALCRDRGFRNRLADDVRDHVVITDYRDHLTNTALRMCGALARLLNERCSPSQGEPLTTAERGITLEGAQLIDSNR